MAADEVLLQSARAGVASLRFYGWSSATVSLGYFQPERLRLSDPRLAKLPFVRRPSGGDTLVHDQEVTYALALPAGLPWQPRGGSWLQRMHGIIGTALHQLGIAAQLHEPAGPQKTEGPLCFHHFTPGDVLLSHHKIVGSAQRRQAGALMQHGAILLAQSEATPSLPGIRELSGFTLDMPKVVAAVLAEFVRQTGWEMIPSDWTEHERRDVEELVASKYGSELWNCKR
jgi:lipoate-protein ligase A